MVLKLFGNEKERHKRYDLIKRRS